MAALGEAALGWRRAGVRDGGRSAALPAGAAPRNSRLELFAWGMAAGSVELETPGLAVVGQVNDDRFALDASWASVVRDEAFHRAMEAVGALSATMAIDVFRSTRRFIGSQGQYWSRAQDFTSPMFARVRLQSARFLAGKPPAAFPELRRAIFFIDGRGEPLDLEAIQRMRLQAGAISLGNHPVRGEEPPRPPTSNLPRKAGPRPKPFVWLSHVQDREALSLFFPGARFVEV